MIRIEKNNLLIRSAVEQDAPLLNAWWNDGRVMEHAGFPNGLGESMEETLENIRRKNRDLERHICIIEIDNVPVGELSFQIIEGVAYPGWKICETGYQNQGYGPKLIIMLFNYLFNNEQLRNIEKIKRIEWDTMLENKRAQHVYETKIGARKIDMLENSWQDQLGRWRTAIVYEITREEFNHRFSEQN